ncbi:MFS transporter [Nocardiopsis eucommiae]|uniref:MFS transporter n=1 Tax=Nocardiopsis eucommiae TaxID=2831970 RepID=A0A975LA15_9ACTN|nr:MFS transporter [Nocardiopsis eucommiae]
MHRKMKRNIPAAGRYLISASAFSNIGDGVYIIAFPLVGATLTDDPRVIAALAAIATLPRILISLPVGVITDRWNRRRIMVSANLLRSLILLVLLLAITSGRIELWHLFFIAFLLGCGEVFSIQPRQLIYRV